MDDRKLYGLIAEFEKPDELLAAVQKVREFGYRRIDAYAPYPLQGLSEALGLAPSPVPFFVLAGVVGGAVGGYAMQYFATVIDYPLNIGGRPLHSWPTYIPITFEVMILLGALAAVFSVFVLNGLPQPYHPVFNVPEFKRATIDRFYLSIEKRDPNFDLQSTRAFLQRLGATQVSEVEL
jgi:hypothetical protein